MMSDHNTKVEKVYASSYSARCSCGFSDFVTGSRARDRARSIAAEHRRQQAANASSLDYIDDVFDATTAKMGRG